MIRRSILAAALPSPVGMSWGKLLDRWHDEGRTYHLLGQHGAPACGTSYYTSTGRYPEPPAFRSNCCGNCNRIAARAVLPTE